MKLKIPRPIIQFQVLHLSICTPTINPNQFMAEISSTEDGDLVRRFRCGDINAAEELYRLYFDRLYSMVFNQVGRNHKNTEEVVQESWLAIIKSAKKFKGQSQLFTWIYKIAWYKIKDFQRVHYRDIANLQPPSDQTTHPELQLIDTEPLPQELVESEETGNLVRNAMSTLPPHYQQVLTLKYLENLSLKEISEVMDKSTKSVSSLLERARLALRDQVNQLNR
jgi:RNA polymerase sigma-70 factor, ECF subfamily